MKINFLSVYPGAYKLQICIASSLQNVEAVNWRVGNQTLLYVTQNKKWIVPMKFMEFWKEVKCNWATLILVGHLNLSCYLKNDFWDGVG